MTSPTVHRCVYDLAKWWRDWESLLFMHSMVRWPLFVNITICHSVFVSLRGDLTIEDEIWNVVPHLIRLHCNKRGFTSTHGHVLCVKVYSCVFAELLLCSIQFNTKRHSVEKNKSYNRRPNFWRYCFHFGRWSRKWVAAGKATGKIRREINLKWNFQLSV